MSTVLGSGDIARLTAICTDVDQVSITSFFYEVDSEAGAGATDLQFATQWSAVVAPLLKPLLYTSATFNGVMCQKVFPLPIPSRVVDVTDAGNGTGGITGLPRQTAGLISWKTAMAGRAFRGRTYLPFPSVTPDIIQGIPSGAYVTAAGVLASAIMGFTLVTGTGGSLAVALGIYHRKTLTLDDITAFSVPQKWATQKRRGSFGKTNVSPI